MQAQRLTATDCNVGIINDAVLIFHATTVALARGGYSDYSVVVTTGKIVSVAIGTADANISIAATDTTLHATIYAPTIEKCRIFTHAIVEQLNLKKFVIKPIDE